MSFGFEDGWHWFEAGYTPLAARVSSAAFFSQQPASVHLLVVQSFACAMHLTRKDT